MHRRRGAFTLIELLVVIAIISLLATIIMPALQNAQKLARSSVCRGNLRNIGTALVMYQTNNDDYVVPSYNMTGVTGGPTVPLDGWAPILDRDNFAGGARDRSNLFYCPSTVDVEGVKTGQTGSDPANTKGWMDWPCIRNGTANIAVTMPQFGFNRIIRVSYWINANNPIGSATYVDNDLFYTGSVGYGPGTNGDVIRLTKGTAFSEPARLIVLSDGVYAGRQRDDRIGTTNSRIGYRHPGGVGTANVALADGHVAAITGDKFPRGLGGTSAPADVAAENLQGPYTVYANPDLVFAP